MRLPVAFAIGVFLAPASSCGDCAGLLVTRLGETERTIAVGQSFIATVEEGGTCNTTFTPAPGRARWSSSDTTIVVVDSTTGRVTGKRIGDANVVPHYGVSLNLLVHVR